MRKGKSTKGKFLLALCFVMFLFISFTQTTDVSARLINTAVLVIMFVFIYAGYGNLFTDKGIKEINKCKNDLYALTDELNAMKDMSFDDAIDLLNEKVTFTSDYLKHAFDDYIRERNASFLGNQAYYQCSVSEYIHEDMLDDIGNANFNEFVSNVMTGLGILGTFVGLVVGLHSFDATSAEALTQSISPLIEGIKVAFYTSIFGVVLSLIYGTIYRQHMNDAYAALHEFESAYYRVLGQHPDNHAMAKLLQYQESQTDSMNQFAEDISIAIADVIENKLMPSLSIIPSEIANAVNDVMSPTMMQMSNQFEIIADKLSSAQNEGVERIVDQFVSQMHDIMGGQFDSMKETVQAICEWQEKTAGVLDEALTAIVKNVDDVSAINRALGETVVKLEHYVNQLDEIQTRNDERTESILGSFDTTSEHIVDMTGKVSDLTVHIDDVVVEATQAITVMEDTHSEISELVAAQTMHLRESGELIKTYSEEMSRTIGEEAEEVRLLCKNITENFEAASEKMAQISQQLLHDMEVTMERSYSQFDSQLAKAMEHFSGTLLEMRDTVENAPKVVDVATQKMNKATAEYLAEVKKSQNEYSTSVASFMKDLVNNIAQVKDFTEQMETTVKTISKQIEQQN